jgi:hypothetical protein
MPRGGICPAHRLHLGLNAPRKLKSTQGAFPIATVGGAHLGRKIGVPVTRRCSAVDGAASNLRRGISARHKRKTKTAFSFYPNCTSRINHLRAKVKTPFSLDLRNPAEPAPASAPVHTRDPRPNWSCHCRANPQRAPAEKAKSQLLWIRRFCDGRPQPGHNYSDGPASSAGCTTSLRLASLFNPFT